MILDYLKVFLVGGIICMIGQIFINCTKVTSARILVSYLLVGVIAETIGVYKYVEEFGKAGATVPIVGFGSNLAKGAIQGALRNGLLGAVTGGIEAVSAGIAGVIFISFVVGLIATPKSK